MGINKPAVFGTLKYDRRFWDTFLELIQIFTSTESLSAIFYSLQCSGLFIASAHTT